MKYIFTLLISIFVFSACNSDIDWQEARLDSYGKQFIAQYGWPDKNQTWNTAIQYTVTADIEMGGIWTMKVYTADPEREPNKAYLIGQYEVSADSTVTVPVDGPYTLESICVGIEDGTVCAKKSIITRQNGKIGLSFSEEELNPGSLPHADKMSYCIAYEIVDTLSNYLDFNDIVLEVVHVSGEATADVKLRAVGAKEEMSVNYAVNGEKTVLFENAHLAFGYHSTERLVNVETGLHSSRTPIKYEGLNVGSDFSIAKDAGRFVVSLKTGKKGRVMNLFLHTADPLYLGIPSNVLVIANPKWDWISEGGSYNLDRSSFTFWLKSYRQYNHWWDSVWDPHELVIYEGSTYRPDFDYTDMIFSADDIKQAEDTLPYIDYARLSPYTGEEIGANIGFVVTGRYGGDLKITLQRTDGGPFEWYEEDAYVHVFEDYNVDAGRGYAEACHILISTNTMKDIINKQASLRIVFDQKSTKAEINSVWIRAR